MFSLLKNDILIFTVQHVKLTSFLCSLKNGSYNDFKDQSFHSLIQIRLSILFTFMTLLLSKSSILYSNSFINSSTFLLLTLNLLQSIMEGEISDCDQITIYMAYLKNSSLSCSSNSEVIYLMVFS